MSARTLRLRLLPLLLRPYTKVALTPVDASTELALTPRSASSKVALTPEGASVNLRLSCALQARLSCVRAWTPLYQSCLCFPARIHLANRTHYPVRQECAAHPRPLTS